MIEVLGRGLLLFELRLAPLNVVVVLADDGGLMGQVKVNVKGHRCIAVLLVISAHLIPIYLLHCTFHSAFNR